MDPEPSSFSRKSDSESDRQSRINLENENQAIAEDVPYSLKGACIALVGLVIAITSLGIPLFAVFTNRIPMQETPNPNALDRDGFKSTPPVSFTRTSQPNS